MMFNFPSFPHPAIRTLLAPRLSSRGLALAVAFYLALFDNLSFWGAVLKLFDHLIGHIVFLFSVLVLLVVIFYLLLSLVNFRYIFKPIAILILIIASIANYFMTSYGIMIDKTMMQNILETDPAEAFELLNVKMIYYFVFFGIIPSLLVYRTRIEYKPFHKELSAKLWTALLSVVIIAVIASFFYKDYVSLGRNNGYLRHLINPSNYISSLHSYAKSAFSDVNIVVQPIGEDAKLTSSWQERGKKTLTVLVLGETARADNFSLNGYARDTNPHLGNEDIINFSNVYSCGTATATSVPCMFSQYGRDDYSDSKAKQHEGLLHVLSRAGITVLWRENNSGCKGACNGLQTQDVANLKLPDMCNSDGCYDEILLNGLQGYVDNIEGDAVIVLHQKGSHGPTYHLRYPESFNVFTPACNTNELQNCTREEIANVYDNTILYTDYFLSRVVGFLKKNQEKLNTAMIYMSDHGESLGENGIYLHGLPYVFAPDEQKHIPFIIWLSEGLRKSAHIDQSCLRAQTSAEYSHDNLFHSVLGLMDVETKVYDAGLDIFAGCRVKTMTKSGSSINELKKAVEPESGGGTRS